MHWAVRSQGISVTIALTLFSPNIPFSAPAELTHRGAADVYMCQWTSHHRCKVWFGDNPDSKVHGANIGPTWGRQDPGGPHVGHVVNLAISEAITWTNAVDIGPSGTYLIESKYKHFSVEKMCLKISSEVWLAMVCPCVNMMSMAISARL